MTTAALIWLMAAIGVVIGSGYPIIAVCFTLATVFLILGLRGVETYINNRQARSYRILLPNDEDCRKNARKIVEQYHEFVRDMLFTTADEGNPVISFQFSGPAARRQELLQKLHRLGGRRMREEFPEED
jgi:uncharacterized membrane protein YhiD involved in acid resistance